MFKTFHCPASARLNGAVSCAWLAALTIVSGLAPARAQEIARLYAARAPAGSAFVRVVNPGGEAVRVEFGGKLENLDGQRHPVSDYRIIDAGAAMAVRANGKPLNALRLAAGSFNTVVLTGGKAVLLADATDSRDDLKAELRFYNLSAACDASLALHNGPTVFEHIVYQASAKRNINPVKASLTAACAGAGASAPMPLPTLRSGDHVSLFVFGEAGKPRLHVQADATEAADGAR